MKNPFGHIHVLIVLLAGCSLDATPSESTLTTSDVDGATQNLDTSVPDLAVVLDVSVRSEDVGTTLLDAAAPKDGSGLDSADAISQDSATDGMTRLDASDANADATIMDAAVLDQGEDGGPAIARCDDTLRNAAETDIDCGGPDCMPCGAGSSCRLDRDCDSGICDNLTCAQPVCGDGVVNGDEQCDDGNDVSADGCEADCTLPTVVMRSSTQEKAAVIAHPAQPISMMTPRTDANVLLKVTWMIHATVWMMIAMAI